MSSMDHQIAVTFISATKSVLLPMFVIAVLLRQVDTKIVSIGYRVVAGDTYISGDSSATYVDVSANSSSHCTAIKWTVFIRVPHQAVRLQIWRPIHKGVNNFRLIGEYRVVAPSVGIHEYLLHGEDRIHMLPGDSIGFTNEGMIGPVPYTPRAKSTRLLRRSDDEGVLPVLSSVYEFESGVLRRQHSFRLDTVSCPSDAGKWVLIGTVCLSFRSSPFTWERASAFCHVIRGGGLLKLTSDVQIASITNEMNRRGMGITWLHMDMDEMTSLRRLINHGVTRQCKALYANGSEVAMPCSSTMPFICHDMDGPLPSKTITKMSKNNFLITETHAQSPPIFKPKVIVGGDGNQDTDCFYRSSWPEARMLCPDPQTKALLSKIQNVPRSIQSDIEIFGDVLQLTKERNDTLENLLTGYKVLREMSESTSSLAGAKYTKEDVVSYIQKISTVTSILIGGKCGCLKSWNNLEKERMSPLDVADAVDVLVTRAAGGLASASPAELTASTHELDVKISRIKDGSNSILSIPGSAVVNFEARNSTGRERSVTVIAFRSLHTMLKQLQTEDNRSIISQVVSIGVEPPMTVNRDWIVITLPHSQMNNMFSTEIDGGEPVCAFWNITRDTSGHWSDRGCDVVRYSANETVCRCSHATSFSVLMQPFAFPTPRRHEVFLSLITLVGCALSIVGLSATVITLMSLRCFSDRGKILINMTTALLIADIVFVGGIQQTRHKALCTLVALSLQYFYLATFCWMLIQGLELYCKLKHVFSQTSRLPGYIAAAWGVPAVIVGVAYSVRHASFTSQN